MTYFADKFPAEVKIASPIRLVIILLSFLKINLASDRLTPSKSLINLFLTIIGTMAGSGLIILWPKDDSQL
ncbi:MAG: hypothetical protein AAB969_01260, partial [Patescibacteria group bacterium]